MPGLSSSQEQMIATQSRQNHPRPTQWVNSHPHNFLLHDPNTAQRQGEATSFQGSAGGPGEREGLSEVQLLFLTVVKTFHAPGSYGPILSLRPCLGCAYRTQCWPVWPVGRIRVKGTWGHTNSLSLPMNQNKNDFFIVCVCGAKGVSHDNQSLYFSPFPNISQILFTKGRISLVFLFFLTLNFIYYLVCARVHVHGMYVYVLNATVHMQRLGTTCDWFSLPVMGSGDLAHVVRDGHQMLTCWVLLLAQFFLFCSEETEVLNASHSAFPGKTLWKGASPWRLTRLQFSCSQQRNRQDTFKVTRLPRNTLTSWAGNQGLVRDGIHWEVKNSPGKDRDSNSRAPVE